MKEYTLINKKDIEMNKALKDIQKASCKKYHHRKGHFPKAKIGKVVKLREENNFYDLTNSEYAKKNILNLDKDVILSKIKNQGVCGLSGSGFSTAQKLHEVLTSNAKDKYLIVNGVECDPGLIHDDWLIKNHYDEIEKGIQLLTECVKFTKVFFATKEENLSNNTCYEVYTVPNRYPMGAEKILIRTILGIPIAQDEIPAKKGILVVNVQTVHAIYEAVYMNRPANSRFITVADLSNGEAFVARVNLNTSIIDITSKVAKVIKNQPIYLGSGIMAGSRVNAESKITAKTNFMCYGLEISHFKDEKCKRCGACTRKCPMKIKVNKIVQRIEKNALANIKELHPEHCIQCGTCTYYCKAGKNIMGLVGSLI